MLEFPDADWEFAQKIYGWSAFQFQAWLKGHILNFHTVNRTVKLYPDSVLELWINDIHVFGGDFLGFGRAPVIVQLQPGLNEINVRLVREVRSMGGSFPPTIRASLRAQLVFDRLEVDHDSVMLSDVVHGHFCSRYGSITVRNQADVWVKIHHVAISLSDRSFTVADREVQLAPGQSRLVKLVFDLDDILGEDLNFVLRFSGEDFERRELNFRVGLRHTGISSLQKITFLHPSGAVSYAMLRPPTSPSTSANQQVPVLLNLHGAGVEADGPLARHMFDGTPDLPAWILSPTGMSPWSGDDWHTWGFSDAQAAVAAIPDWIERINWKGPGVFLEKVLVAGHSNGAQGTWYFASHQPDRVLGLAAASGYSSIENYVPYVLWNEADPLQSGILQASRNSFRHELLTENMVGLPICQQHGSADDNVPTYHSRLMNTLLVQVGELANYSEIPDGGHWFDGTMTTAPMVAFYLHHLTAPRSKISAPSMFTFVAPNSDDMGSKYGISIDQLSIPDRLGRVQVAISVHGSLVRWHLRTENIHRLHFTHDTAIVNRPDEILLDDLPHPFNISQHQEENSFVKSDSNIWGREVAHDWRNLDQRYGRQRGALDSILRSRGAFEIVYCSDRTLAIAVQASRNFLQYYGADTNIVPFSMYENALGKEGNVITICLGTSIPEAQLPRFPIQLLGQHILLTRKDSGTTQVPLVAGMGGVWLRPLPGERLELLIWGYDEVGLRQAARLIPTLTGAGQPDFVILGDSARWKGHAGASAMGFFDYKWRISSASYLP